MKWLMIAVVILCMSTPTIARSGESDEAEAPATAAAPAAEIKSATAPEVTAKPPENADIIIGVVARNGAIADKNEPRQDCSISPEIHLVKGSKAIIAGICSCKSPSNGDVVPFFKFVVVTM